MWRTMRNLAGAATICLFILLGVCGSAYAQAGVTAKTGPLSDGATYLIEVPANWNGTLFLYSHGYVTPGSPNPATDVGDPITRFFMLSSGFALAGSSYATTGWAIQQALPDQIAVLDKFNQLFSPPKQTIAWGHSLGGIITAGLIQTNPQRFDAALPMCGVLSGGVATWNTSLDSEFAFKTLLAPGTGLQLVNIADPVANLDLAEVVLAEAQSTPQGRARLALAAALADLPGWFTPTSPEPAPTDFADQQINQFLWQQQVDFPFVFAFRAELEARAQGNVSWNTGVDYRRQLDLSIGRDEVIALYAQAGLDLDADLDTLEKTARISADPEAVHYLEKYIIFDGEIHIPVLTLHTKGDGLVVVQNEEAYKDVVDEVGNGKFLRRTFVSRAGHCAFTPAETIAAVQTLLGRLDTGKWQGVQAGDLNNAAAALGPNFNVFATSQGVVPVPPAFIEFHPGPYLRPFDAFSPECLFDDRCRDDFFGHGPF
ncbi:MAG TPA: prolyl oligopeptidase family serine peptidase [Candidatus Acidoferrum sp.]|nr:prolyl oligopeptidase family serine peptidase [Candidatus Acidoferrum sp.]